MGMQQAASGGVQQAIDPQIVSRLMAAYQANPSLRIAQGEGEGGVTYTGDPAATVDGYTIFLDPNTGKPQIAKGLSHKTWGQDVAAVYDTDGKFQGINSGDSEALSAAKFGATAVGGYYAVGAANAAMGGAAAGGGAATGGAAAAGASASEQIAMLAANGMSDAAIAQAFPALAEAGGLTGISGGGIAAAAEGAGQFRPSANYGEGLTGNQTAVYDKTMSVTGNGSVANTLASNGTVADGLVSAGDLASSLSDANSVKNATDAASNSGGGSKGMNWLDVVNTAATVYGISKAGDASSDATKAATDIATGQMDLNKQALDWYKQVYADQAPARDAAATRANAISDAQLRGMNFAIDQATELDNYNKTTFRPIEQRLAAEATDYNTEGRREQAAQQASGRVASEFDNIRSTTGRNMTSVGVDPSTIAALDASSRIDEAKARAGASNDARTTVENQGWSRMADVANMGRGIASQQATQQGIATTTGNSSATNAATGLNATTSGNQFMGTGFSNATQGNQVASSMFNNVARTQQADDQMLLTGVSGLTNYLGNKYPSSKKVKSGTSRMMDNAKALEQVEDLPVKAGWKYSPEKGGPDDGGKKHSGPMAEDAQRVMGDDVAPGGEAIDIQSMNGRMLGAIKELSKRVKALEAA